MTPVVETQHLGKTYATPAGPVPVLHDVNLTIGAGEFCAVTGPSGSGKTTLLNLLALLDQPTEGRLLVNGIAVEQAGEATRIDLRKRSIGMVFQKFCLLPHRDVLENVLFRARYLEVDRAQMTEQAMVIMEKLGLARLARREARLLSGGEMQRVAIARALLVTPSLLVADEPTGNLDREAAATVMEALAAANRDGITVLLVTHNLSLLEYATTHYECREGRLCPAT